MSHFTVYVFTKEDGKDIEQLLAPYDESITYPPYIQYTKEQAIAKTRKEIEDYKNGLYAEYIADPVAYIEKHQPSRKHLDYIKNEFPKRLNWTDEECYEEQKQWYEEYNIDEDGNLMSTYNPNSKWDWYQVGGRWNGNLITKEGNNTNEDFVNQIDWEKTMVPFAFVTPDGKWYERGEMGWWAVVSNEKTEENWNEEFRKAVEKYGDATVTVVDCHI